MSKKDEREIIAKEFAKMWRVLEEKKIDRNYAEYVIFVTLGSLIRLYSRNFEGYITEILQKTK